MMVAKDAMVVAKDAISKLPTLFIDFKRPKWIKFYGLGLNLNILIILNALIYSNWEIIHLPYNFIKNSYF